MKKIAPMSGTYRCQCCRYLGQVKYYEEGEEFRPCSSCKGKITWAYWTQDNILGDEIKFCLVGTEVISSFVVNKIPEEDDTLNLKGLDNSSKEYNGLYKVKVVELNTKRFPYITVERVSDIDISKPLHNLGLHRQPYSLHLSKKTLNHQI